MRRIICCVAIAIAGFAVVGPRPVVARPAPVVTAVPSATDGCRDLTFRVKLLPQIPVRYRVVGRLCGPDTTLVQVLLAGATESGLAFWDFPGRAYYEGDAAAASMRESYSYAAHVAANGGTALALDRIGTGASDHPPAELVTIDSNAYVVHQVIQALRRGDAGVGPFARVVTVGRSLAAAVTYVEAATYHDVDGIVTQSYSQTKQPAFANFPTSFQPAQLDSRFAGLIGGYVTTRQGTRAGFFFTPSADPAVVAHEEATKDTLTDAEIPTFVKTFLPGLEVTRSVDVPVLSLLGDADTFFCSGPGCPDAALEASFFPLAPCFTSTVVNGVGHNMNLEPNADSRVFPILHDWVTDNFAAGNTAC